jgi:hypothetical protein
MADWRQIQARIRKAKTSSDPAVQLAELYERTRDAMVAFELAQWHEKAGNAGDTVQWYTTAAQRFRRAQWRTKAEEALTRLGAPIPEPIQIPDKEPGGEAAAALSGGPRHDEGSPEGTPPPAYETSMEAESEGLHAGNGRQPSAVAAPFEAQEKAESGEDSAAPAGAPGGKRRRRGRRGGRKRHGRGAAGPQAAGAASAARPVTPMPGRSGEASSERSFSSSSKSRVFETAERDVEPGRSFEGSTETSHERTDRGAASAWQGGTGGLVSGRSRAGDPGLSSRIAQLESQLRRLLACPLASLEDADQAPAGPGVLLLSDSDQVTHYYVESCQTLRIGIGNLLRGGRGSRGGSQLKPSLAEHLGINESRVSKYLKDHCAVRWIQLDEGAPALAHFATAVLRPVVAE